MKEEWKQIRLKNGELVNYFISNTGKVMSSRTGKIMNGTPNGTHRNLLVTLRNNQGKKEYMYIHRMVAEAFLDNDIKGKEIIHKDGDVNNNLVSNLSVIDKRSGLNSNSVENERKNAINCISKEIVRCKLNPVEIVKKYDITLRIFHDILYRVKFAEYTKDFLFDEYIEKYGKTSFRYKTELRDRICRNETESEIIKWLMDTYNMNDRQAKYIYQSQLSFIADFAEGTNRNTDHADKCLLVDDMIVQGKSLEDILFTYFSYYDNEPEYIAVKFIKTRITILKLYIQREDG